MFLKDWSEAVQYRFSDSGEYNFGDKCQLDARFLEYWDEKHDGVSAACVYSPDEFVVLSMSVCKYNTNTCYKWINPDYKDIESYGEAYDDVEYIGITLEEDILEKISKIVDYEPFDDRIMVPLNFSKDEMYDLMMQAHIADLSVNRYVENALRQFIETKE